MLKFFVALMLIVGLTNVANAQFQKGDFDLTLNGAGHSDKNLSNTSASATVGLGYFVQKDLELGVRQSVTHDSGFAGATSVFTDYNFSLMDGKLSPYVGVSAGYNYGVVANHWTAGPEVGVRYFVAPNAYVFGNATYQFDLNRGPSTGSFGYGVGVGFRW